jgi:hypothetical protein
MAALLLRPAATAIDWEIIKGESFTITVPVLDSSNAPVTVDGWSAKAQVRRSEDDAVLFEWSATASNITVSGTSVLLSVVGSATALWAWSAALVSVVVYEPSTAKPHVIASGTLAALPQITQ